MSRCAVCKAEAEWAWQPFGPDSIEPTAATLGSHYRGFPAIKLCDVCLRDAAQNGFEFMYKGQRYIIKDKWPVEVPEYVSDALLWLEDQPRGE
jgi:hypothetical protein